MLTTIQHAVIRDLCLTDKSLATRYSAETGEIKIVDDRCASEIAVYVIQKDGDTAKSVPDGFGGWEEYALDPEKDVDEWWIAQ